MNIPHHSTDEELVRRLAQHDRDALALLYERYSRAIYVMAVYMLGAGEAEEAVQDVFVRLWNRASQYDPVRGPFGNWFMTLVRNYLKDKLRHHNLQDRIMSVGEINQLLEDVADPRHDVEEELQVNQRDRALLQALQQLPPEQRRALILAYFSGLSQSTIAAQLQWPLGTVKKRIQLGLRKLRVLLSGQGLAPEPEMTETGKE